MRPTRSVVRAIRWVARIWGTAAALFWGAFFVEHLEWFTLQAALPPVRVWVLEGLLFVVIAALLCAWRYERAGGTIALFASVVFFAAVAGQRFWPFLLTTAIPAVAFIVSGRMSGDERLSTRTAAP